MATSSLQLAYKLFFRGYIIAQTGLSIGGTDTGLGAGGADRVVIRDPLTFRPYIPGSTLKGRMRSLLERLYGEFDSRPNQPGGGPIRKPQSPETKTMTSLFGLPADDSTPVPGRLAVRDAKLVNGDALDRTRALDLPYTELKTEVTIDRITARTTPHHYERVPAGAIFALDLVVTIYEVDGQADNRDELLQPLFAGLRLIQDESLGACGSRGYGKIKIHLEQPTMKTRESYLKGGAAEPATDLVLPEDLQHDDEEHAAIAAQLDSAKPATPKKQGGGRPPRKDKPKQQEQPKAEEKPAEPEAPAAEEAAPAEDAAPATDAPAEGGDEAAS